MPNSHQSYFTDVGNSLQSVSSDSIPSARFAVVQVNCSAYGRLSGSEPALDCKWCYMRGFACAKSA